MTEFIRVPPMASYSHLSIRKTNVAHSQGRSPSRYRLWSAIIPGILGARRFYNFRYGCRQFPSGHRLCGSDGPKIPYGRHQVRLRAKQRKLAARRIQYRVAGRRSPPCRAPATTTVFSRGSTTRIHRWPSNLQGHAAEAKVEGGGKYSS